MLQDTIERPAPDATAQTAAGATAGEDFAARLMKAFNESAMVLMISIGHRTGLFDAMDGAPPLTSAGLAVRVGLDERYVREWLAVMATSGVVTYRAQGATYHLPPAHAAWLTRAASPDNLAVIAQMIPGLGCVETPLVGCFRNGGGLAYDQYHRFHEVMAEDSGQTVVAALFDHILPLVPGLHERLEAGIGVLDVGCGAGRAMVALAERFPASRFTGYDLTEEGVAMARAAAAQKGLKNVVFEQRDLAAAPPDGRYDLVTAFDAIHDLGDPAGLLGAIARALAPDGVFLMQDIGGASRLEDNMDHPLAPFLYAVSTAHCMSVSLAQGGPGLGTMWGIELAQRMLAEAGFADVRTHRLDHDPINVYFVART